jgi:hypothetical protein
METMNSFAASQKSTATSHHESLATSQRKLTGFYGQKKLDLKRLGELRE